MEKQDLTQLKIERSAKPTPAFSARRRRRRFLWLLTLALVSLLAYLVYEMLNTAIPVEVGTVTTAYPSQAFTLLNATGYVVPQTKADVASKATGRLESLQVEEGSRVKKGQIIARLENQDVIAQMNQAQANIGVAQASLRQAQAELKEATLALDRAQNLIKKRIIPQESHDAASARYDKAVAAVRSAKAAIKAAHAAHHGTKIAVEYTLIRAPFDGVILSKHANIGDVVAPFSSTTESKGAVVSMADLDTLEVEADVSESNLLKLRLGQPCEIQLDALPDTRFRCVVNRIVPTVDRTKATVLVKVRFVDKDSRLLPEMSAKVAFLSQELTPGQQKPVTVVPPSAIVLRKDKVTAFLVHGGTAYEVHVATGERIGEAIVVLKGLSPGDEVVLNPPEALRDGSPIKPART